MAQLAEASAASRSRCSWWCLPRWSWCRCAAAAAGRRRRPRPQEARPARPSRPERRRRRVSPSTKKGKVAFSIKFGNQADLRRRPLEVRRRRHRRPARQERPPDHDRVAGRRSHESAGQGRSAPPTFTGGVTLTTSDGIIVTIADRHLQRRRTDDAHPGPLHVQEGTHDRDAASARPTTRRANVLWLLDQAKVDVAADKKGSGAIHVTSKTAGMARAEHYMKFHGRRAPATARGTSRTADEATAFLTEDDERMTRMELRGNSRITGKPGGSGPQDMRANDIDLAYAEDGRTLQSARLVENASVQLPGEKGKSRDAASPARRHRHRAGARRRDGDQSDRERERPGRSAGGRRHAGTADPIRVAARDRRARRRHPGGDLLRRRRVSRKPRRARQGDGASIARRSRRAWTSRRSRASATSSRPTSTPTSTSPTARRRPPTRRRRSTRSRRTGSI